MKKINRVMIANRGEIAIRIIRACNELGLKTIAVYSEEDKMSLFRTKADESYLIGVNKRPVEAYLDIDGIISLALEKRIDAIHPGYGFLSESSEFARRCGEVGIEFIGPSPDAMDKMGDKIKSKIVARSVGVPVAGGLDKPISDFEEISAIADSIGYPVILKASAGGGGRGMRVVYNREEIETAFISAQSQARMCFDNDDMFVEKYIEKPKHIEVQVLGDKHGNLLHLYERDCSIQRRHQKVIELTPAVSLSPEKRKAICDDAIKIAKAAGYSSAGTVEFLVDINENHYFIEMNPRIQVEHTITEMITGIDLVQCQILIAEGHALNSDEIGLYRQEDIKPRGYAIQSRVTTEDPTNNFIPNTGTVDVYRSGSGFGIRLDGGNDYAGAIISPYYDNLFIKITAHGRTFKDAIRKSTRALKELTITGLNTNIGFLLNVLSHDTFIKGECHTGFIEENPELLNIKPRDDEEFRLIKFIGEKIVNESKKDIIDYEEPVLPELPDVEYLDGTKRIMEAGGPEAVVRWIKEQKKLLLTDTTMRDAQQSLVATRVRSTDMFKIAEATAYYAKDLFSLEMWGGGSFDAAYQHLKESPWVRLDELRKRIPNILFQMLLRGKNAVGYKSYPDNVLREFIKESAASGIDVFRIFDSLNNLGNMESSLDEVLKYNKIAEMCICYTGDILDDSRDKYSLDYYVKKSKEIEKMGAHILGIKDMAALLKPYAAVKLINALKQEISIPIHLHTHDSTGTGVATVLMAAYAGVDIADTAFNSMSGRTSQPTLNSVVAALENTNKETGLQLKGIQKISDYWGTVRPVYSKFESGLSSGSTDMYTYEIPGGQYSNLKLQMEDLGMGHRFHEVKKMYSTVNDMMGDIVKVAPTSKMVGDMALFMVQNELSPENIYQKAKDMDFPESVVSYFQGVMGQPKGGFPRALQDLVLKDIEPIINGHGNLVPLADCEAIEKYLKEKFDDYIPTRRDLISYAIFPDIFEEYLKFRKEYGNLERMGSDVFFHGLYEGETREIEVAEGRIMIVKFVELGKHDSKGNRILKFEVNGIRREIKIKDKMQTQIVSPHAGTVSNICIKEKQRVKTGDLLVEII
ncbi:MAG: pyruvate carboxylase [Eubacteriales bacterium]|nr:pyruvate carboxylase [Eubacteriales bacterium]